MKKNSVSKIWNTPNCMTALDSALSCNRNLHLCYCYMCPFSSQSRLTSLENFLLLAAGFIGCSLQVSSAEWKCWRLKNVVSFLKYNFFIEALDVLNVIALTSPAYAAWPGMAGMIFSLYLAVLESTDDSVFHLTIWSKPANLNFVIYSDSTFCFEICFHYAAPACQVFCFLEWHGRSDSLTSLMLVCDSSG